MTHDPDHHLTHPNANPEAAMRQQCLENYDCMIEAQEKLYESEADNASLREKLKIALEAQERTWQANIRLAKLVNCGDCDPCLGDRPDQCALLPATPTTHMPTLVKGAGPGVIGDSDNRVFALISHSPARPTNEDVDALAHEVIRAVNHHADLVAALREIQRIGETELVHKHPSYGEAPHSVALIAQQAIAKAEGRA